MSKKIWLITGISGGLGKALAEAVLADGDTVIGTSRDARIAAAFTASHQPAGVGLVLDLADAAAIDRLVAAVAARFGRLDVLVNNAGAGFGGAVEEASDAETREAMETNFFGPLHLTRAVLPLMRAQRAGHIVQISSHGGFQGMAGFGIYNAAKFALEGISEALAVEGAPLGIRLTIVQPGPFRTRFAGSAFREAARVIADYAPTAGLFRQRIRQVDGRQEGDPARAARAIRDVVRAQNPPLRLPLGRVALLTIAGKLASVQRDLEAARPVAESAVFAD